MKGPAGIRLESVTKVYATPTEQITALAGITLDLEPGGSLAITGPSGSGKSTLLGLIGTLEAPTAGRVIVGDQDISLLSDRRRARLRRDEFGFVFQQDNLLPFLTGVENVVLQLELKGARDGIGRCLETLAALGLGDEVHRVPDQLSGGQRQRVAVASVIAKRPRIILADEPTGSLDTENSAAVIDILLDLHREAGTTLVIATHDAEVARRMDRAFILRDGRQVQEGPRPRPLEAGRPDV
jgi:putative ABC transport system ATP-binding protein